MKKFLRLAILFLNLTICATAHPKENPPPTCPIKYDLGFNTQKPQIEKFTILTTFMIKNEEENIGTTLQSYIDGGLKHFLIYDTGSTDNTIEITKKTFEKNEILEYEKHKDSAYLIIQEEFINFAISRNKALSYSHQNFPHAEYIIMPDAEWHIRNPQKLIEFCKTQATNKETNSYTLKITGTNLEFYTNRLIKNNGKSWFWGPVHEVIIPASRVKVPEEIYFEYLPTQKSIEKTNKRWVQDLEILSSEYEKNPNDSRTIFYLGQTYEGLKDLENAKKFYSMRTEKNSNFPEEKFIAMYRLGNIEKQLDNWKEAQSIYLDAYNINSERIEPLVEIAEHYWPENPTLVYFFGKMFTEEKKPYPQNSFLFIEKEKYNFNRHEIISKSAWYNQDCQMGLETTKKLLENYNHQVLKDNLKFYEECFPPAKPQVNKEKFQAHMDAAKLFENYGEWPLALQWYLDAHSLWTANILPIIKIIEHYTITKKYHTAYLFLNEILEIEYNQDSPKLEQFYNTKKYELLADIALEVQECSKGLIAVQYLIENLNQKTTKRFEQLSKYLKCTQEKN